MCQVRESARDDADENGPEREEDDKGDRGDPAVHHAQIHGAVDVEAEKVVEAIRAAIAAEPLAVAAEAIPVAISIAVAIDVAVPIAGSSCPAARP